jgi:hypothetical protein
MSPIEIKLSEIEERNKDIAWMADIAALVAAVRKLAEAVDFYGDTEKMYDTAHDSGGDLLGYVRGVDPYDTAESDFEKLPGLRTLHHGKRARATLSSVAEILGGKE